MLPSPSNPAWFRYVTFWRRDPRAELDQELAFHFEARVDEYIASGLDPDAARALAVERLGDLTRVRDDCRRIEAQYARRRSMTDSVSGVLGDLRHAVRQLARQRAFAAAAIACLVLGIGVNTAIFSVVDAVVFRPLPFRDPGRLVMIGEALPVISDQNMGTISTPDFGDFAKLNGSLFASSSVFDATWFTLAGRGSAQRLAGLEVSASLFRVLGVGPALGRAFQDGDDAPGAPDAVVLTDALWRRQFGGDHSIVGRTILLDGRPFTVLGVMPAGFTFPLPGLSLEPAAFFVPLRMTPGVMQGRGNSFNAHMIARLAPGVSVDQATAAVNTIAGRLPALYPTFYSPAFRVAAAALPFRAHLVSDVRGPLIVLLGAVAFVLLIACINVAGLLLARAAARSRELAVRRALGASRGRLTAQYLTEGAVLAAPGAFGALLLAHWCTAALARLAPDGMLSGYRLGLDARVLTFTVAVTLLVIVLFSLVPALSGSALGLANTLRDEGRGTSAGRTKQRARRVLVASEIALALVLTTGAGLLARSFANVLKVDPGFTPAHLLTFHIAFPSYRYPKASRVIDAEQALVDSLAHLPGARSATATVNLPTLGGWQIAFSPEGEALPKVPIASNFVVLRDYFQTMGIPVVKGRAFDARDEASSGNVAIIDERLAHQFYGERNPIGLRIKWGAPQSTDPWKTIVGVVRTVPTRGLDQTSPPELYFPARQLAVDSTFVDAALRELTFVVRTERDPLALAPRVQRLVRSIDPQLVVAKVQTVESLVSESVASRRFDLLLIGAFAVLAVLLAAVGLSGLVAYSVVQRQREIGVRLAIGSTQNGIVGLVLRDGLTTAVWGSAFGIAGAFALTRLMRSLLFGVGTLDATTFLATTTILIAVAAFASWLPARRAARIDPMVAIRQE
ncbi:MAG TPA: ABC transporter permease [Gemmatimonadaceae bacterium]|nr:ABC transporter permease [Gemmatimonadaceae bacterium]